MFMQVARHTRPEGHFKVCAEINYFVPGAVATYSWDWNRVYPLYGCRLGYHPSSEAWLVE